MARADQGSDPILVRRAKDGDARAWSDLVDLYGPYVYALLRSARVPESDQADAFQFVFVELHKALPHLRNTDNLAPWVRQTTLREAVRMRRKSEKAPASIDEVEFLLTDESVQRDLERAEESRTVRQALAGLSAKCRELVHRLFFDGSPQPYAEVAAALGIKTSSLVMTRQRCLDALEKALRARGLS